MADEDTKVNFTQTVIFERAKQDWDALDSVGKKPYIDQANSEATAYLHSKQDVV